MTELKKALFAAALAATIAAPLPALAETVLRLDEVAVGELDPAKATDYADSILMFNVYDTLVIPEQGGPGVVPNLASDWKIEGNAYTFNLVDAKFHSGNPVTANDVVYSFDRMMAIGQGNSNLFAKRVEKVEAVDPKTVKFTLSGPFAPFLAALVRLPIIDSTLAKQHQAAGDHGEAGDYSQAWLSGNDAGSGAYRVASHNPQEETNMVKFADYFLGVPAKAPDRVRLRYGIEAPTVRALISRGEHDIGSQWLPPEVVKALAAEGAQILNERGTAQYYLKLNTAKPPLDDVHCRRAVVYSFDYANALKMVSVTDDFALGVPANGPLPHGMMGSDDAPNYVQDMEKAKAERAQCKYTDPNTPLEISWIAEVPLEERIALLMQASTQQVGFKPEVKRVPWALFTEMATKAETTPNVSQLFSYPVTPDPDALLFNQYHSSSRGTYESTENLNDPELDKLLEAARTETDVAKRTELYNQVVKKLRDLAATVYVYDQVAAFVARDVVSAPALMDDSKRFPLSGFGFSFRLMEMKQ
jgi:peptide/nickel transport system substrate-binding protein